MNALPTAKKRRRRRTNSDWLLSLQQTWIARSLRENLPSSNQSTSDLRAEIKTTNDGTGTDGDGNMDDIQSPDDENIHTALNAVRDAASDSLEISVHSNGNSLGLDEDSIEDDSQSEKSSSEDDDDQAVHTGSGKNVPSMLGLPCAGQTGEHHRAVHDHEDGGVTNGMSEAMLQLLRKRRKKWENRHSLSALVAIVGSVRYTVEQYKYTRSVLRDVVPDNIEIWPSYSRVQCSFKDIMEQSMPRSILVHLPKKPIGQWGNEESLSDARQDAANRAVPDVEEASRQTEPVRIFFPSSWAEMDVATSSTFNQMFSWKNRDGADIETAQVVSDREGMTNASRLFFVNKNGENISCFPESLIEVEAQGNAPNCETSIQIMQGDNKFLFEAIVTATWGVGSSSQYTSSVETILRSNSLSYRERRIITSLAKSEKVSDDDVCAIGTVMPGDMCTLLRAKRMNENDCHVPVIVHRFWRSETGMPAIILLWIRTVDVEVSQSSVSSQNPGIQISEYHVISKLGLRRQGNITDCKEAAPRCGELEDGTPFVCYRMMLYCDDFTKSSYSSSAGSLGGCYFMPLGYSPEQRRNTSSVRLISLTPPGVSTNEVLQFIVDDIVQGSIHGLQVRTPDGIDVRVFLDLVGFIGDYPAAVGVIDVFGHVGRAPCTLCSFRRLHKSADLCNLLTFCFMKQKVLRMGTPQRSTRTTRAFSEWQKGIRACEIVTSTIKMRTFSG